MSTTISATLKDYYTRERDILATEPSIRAELQSLGVAHLQAEYDGVGDSGQIDDITFLDGTEPGRPVPVEAQLREQVEDLLYALLTLRHGGWENNDGAFGSFRWDLAEGTMEHEHNARFTDYESTFNEGFEIGTGESP